jgi:hypothetical protein
MSKNTHLEHLEDDIFNNGYAGAQNALAFLEGLKGMLTTGKGGGNMKVTVKWDGAPAIICGIDPETDMFFVGTKSVFAKTEPKICYTHEDIDQWYQGELNTKLKMALDHLSKLPIKGVIQGDLLYTGTPMLTMMGGKKCYKFKPNTITYCVEKDTEMGKKVAQSKIGIVFHTHYNGQDFDSMAAGFGVDVSGLQGNSDVAVFSSAFTNTNGIANLSGAELSKLNLSMRTAKRNLDSSRNFLNQIGGKLTGMEPAALFKIYFNQKIKEGKIPTSAQQMLAEFKVFVESRYALKEAGVKTPKAKEKWQTKKQEAIDYLNSNKSEIYRALAGFKNLITAKEQIINRLKKIEGVGTFLEDENGYKVTSPEGFVAIKDGTAVKLVDRLEFSRANFTVAKDWGK